MATNEEKIDTNEPEEEEMGGLDDGDDETLILISSEDDNPREFEISRKAALMCNLVKSILEGGMDHNSHFNILANLRCDLASKQERECTRHSHSTHIRICFFLHSFTVVCHRCQC